MPVFVVRCCKIGEISVPDDLLTVGVVHAESQAPVFLSFAEDNPCSEVQSFRVSAEIQGLKR